MGPAHHAGFSSAHAVGNPMTIISGPSRIDGTGAFALEDFRARQKLGELDGELITIREARQRARHSKRLHLVELDERRALDCSGGASPLKYVNHSCKPNAFMRIAHGRVEFYARRAIAAGEELTAHYGETHHGGTLACRCGALGCQLFI
jgi:SET domain-containing protein